MHRLDWSEKMRIVSTNEQQWLCLTEGMQGETAKVTVSLLQGFDWMRMFREAEIYCCKCVVDSESFLGMNGGGHREGD